MSFLAPKTIPVEQTLKHSKDLFLTKQRNCPWFWVLLFCLVYQNFVGAKACRFIERQTCPATLSCCCSWMVFVVARKMLHPPLNPSEWITLKQSERFPLLATVALCLSHNLSCFFPLCPPFTLTSSSCPSLVWMLALEKKKSQLSLIYIQSALVPAVNRGLKWKWEGEKEQITLLKRMHCLLAGPPAERREKRNIGGGWVEGWLRLKGKM